jgi:hypothetical protein
MAPKGINEKKQKGMEIKASNKAKKDAAAAAEQKRQEDQEWSKGANSRSMDRATAMGKSKKENETHSNISSSSCLIFFLSCI